MPAFRHPSCKVPKDDAVARVELAVRYMPETRLGHLLLKRVPVVLRRRRIKGDMTGSRRWLGIA